jgi:hypothetical protein
MAERRDLARVDRLCEALKQRLLEHPDKPCWITELNWLQCYPITDAELQEREEVIGPFEDEVIMRGFPYAVNQEIGKHYQHEVLDSIVGLFFEWDKIEESK